MNKLSPLKKAILYIENHLDEDIILSEVAKDVGYSYYHFTRIFHSLLGESLSSYIKKRRLSNSAEKLLSTDKKILEIALESGFESSEAYSRAFKKIYGINPISYRKNNVDLIICKKNTLDDEFFFHVINNLSIKPKIVYIDNIDIIGLRKKTSLQNNNIPELWDEFWKLHKYIDNCNTTKRYFGICEYSAVTPYTMNTNNIFVEFVGVEGLNIKDIPIQLTTIRINAGKYAVFTHFGAIKDINKTYQYIWNTWFFETNEVIDQRADFELYDERFLGKNDNMSQVDIYIPIK